MKWWYVFLGCTRTCTERNNCLKKGRGVMCVRGSEHVQVGHPFDLCPIMLESITGIVRGEVSVER